MANYELHRCKICGCLWRLFPPDRVLPGGAWSLLNAEQKPGPCCDNVAMGDQIEKVKDPTNAEG